jgi:Undecaprenyl-phosphate glucose phosphotransferase
MLLAGRLGSSAIFRALPQLSRQRAVLVGNGPQAARFAASLTGRHDQGVALLGLVDNDAVAAAGSGGLPYLGPVTALDGMIRRGEVDQVVLCMPWAEERRVRDMQAMLADYPVDVCLAPDLLAYRHNAAEAPRLLRLADRPIRGWAAVVKAIEDYVLAIGALAVAAVPMALIALAVRLDSPGPALFRQRRTGFNNRDFYVLKFRTMYHDAADPTVQRQVLAGDPRVTRVGAILRRTSLDELPQIFNVLRGDMSFIGPRPHAPGTRAGDRPFEEVMARYAARHRVKPGLTGLAQVRGWRGPTETEDKLIRRVESDLEYIETWSPWLDLVILVRTLLAVARMRNAC